MDMRLNKWIRWLGVIHDDIQQLLIKQHIFWEVQAIIENNERIHRPSAFYRFLGDTYVAYETIGIRRQLKIDKKSISFARLLKEMQEHPSILTRSYYRGLYRGSRVEHWADRDFDKFSDGGDHISPSMVGSDLDHLGRTGKMIEDFADKRIAHRDKGNPKTVPRFHEVDSCLATLDKTYVKYHLLFRAESMSSLMPTFQYDWKEIFHEPWLTNRQ